MTKPKGGSRRAGAGPPAEPERLQKVLARAGLASRREAEEWIRAGRITINGEPAVLGVRVGPYDQVKLDGRLIRQRPSGGGGHVFLCHRSPGENLKSPAESGEQASTEGTALLDRLPRRAGSRFIPVSPMPRIDGGLELVTSDGEIALKLQRSVRALTSEFSVRVHGELGSSELERILEGTLDSGEKLYVERCEAAGGEGSNRWYAFVARGASGKDVRQLFERQGALVSRVLRTRLGTLALDRHLARGRFRELEPDELDALIGAAKAAPPQQPDADATQKHDR
jgi:23S rRNA pseudouridine2605 synthase